MICCELPILNIELKFRFNRINSDYCPGKNLGILVAGDSDNGVESLVASSSGQNFYAGTLGGQDSLWDVSSQVAKWQLAVSSGPLIKLVLGEGDDVCINLKVALHSIKSKNIDDVFY